LIQHRVLSRLKFLASSEVDHLNTAAPLARVPDAAIDGFGKLEDFADCANFRAALSAAVESSDPQAGFVEAAKSFQDAGRAAIRQRFEESENAGLPASHALAALQDEIVSGLFEATEALYPLPHPTSSERLSIVAVGGYGRGGLAPQSDIDLLFLLPYKRTAWAETMVETILYALWDLGLKVGQATRSIEECLRLAKSDMTIRTSLLETRLLTGDADLYADMKTRLWGELFSKTAQEFVSAKLDERHDRHARTGDSRYMLEPNIKEGKGALRDLHSLFWIGKYIYQSRRQCRRPDRKRRFYSERSAPFRRCGAILLDHPVLDSLPNQTPPRTTHL